MSVKYQDGTRDGIRWAITWLHERARKMNDPHAKAVLNSAAFELGQDLSDWHSPVDTKEADGGQAWPAAACNRFK